MGAIASNTLAVLVLAAGKGNRMNSNLAKVLHKINGLPLLEHVLMAAKPLNAVRTVVVVGHQADDVRKAFAADPSIQWALQKQMLGTGDAVKAASSELIGASQSILILYGDIPGIRLETLRALVEQHQKDGPAITLLTTTLQKPKGYGRIVRGEDGSVDRIVEEKDASQEERAIQEVNTGIGVWDSTFLFHALPLLTPNNQQKEYYLTDLIEMARSEGLRVGRFHLKDSAEVLGINTPEQLEEVAKAMKRR